MRLLRAPPPGCLISCDVGERGTEDWRATGSPVFRIVPSGSERDVLVDDRLVDTGCTLDEARDLVGYLLSKHLRTKIVSVRPTGAV